MTESTISNEVKMIMAYFDPLQPEQTAGELRRLWLQYEPKSMVGIKSEERAKQETVGIPVAILRKIGKEVGNIARQKVDDFIPLAKTLWNDFGREARIVTVVFLGHMELVDPEQIMPLCLQLSRTCITWEDADQMAMRAVEPIVRKDPDGWLSTMNPWLSDESKWVRRVGVIVLGRLPMKHAAYTGTCLQMIEPLLTDQDTDVKKGVSFAIRLCARGDVDLTREFLSEHVPPQDEASAWVLCDAIRSMAKNLLPEFVPLLPKYEQWAADSNLSSRNRKSVVSAINTLRNA